MRSLSAAVVQRSPKHLMMVVIIMVALVFTAIAWMNWAEIDVVVRGNGKVVPSRQVQVVQSLEGGVVSDILVQEGDLVKAGQAMLKLSDVAFSSSFEENRLLYSELQARSIRLEAEANGSDFNASMIREEIDPTVLESEKSLFESNRQQLSETLSIFGEQIRQHESALEEAQSKVRRLKKSLALLKQEIEIKKPLAENRIISEIEYLQLQQREAEAEGELDIASISIPRLRSAIEEAKGKLEQSRLDFRNKAKLELNETLAELSRVAETQTALEDRVTRTTLRSPVDGVVKRLHANTIGGVVSPGNKVLEVVPLGDSLLVEVQIKPADIASIDVGQKTRLKFSAYDFAIHGGVAGEVVFVSADTITNDEGESYYIVRVLPEQIYLDETNKRMEIKVGMTSEADIITSKKTILEYLLKPINRGLQKALTES
ncbi:MAG: HlyD family type I secretion periplasmic adaptor subunit [Oleiphilus sp.]|nr:MAG: HlyD family type I secretion periplasmic adaptor subunit [Oleiphilus sp.]